VKCFDSDKHKRYTGVENKLILDNLKGLLSVGARVWVRIPIIPTVNDSPEEMESIRDMLRSFGAPDKIELLPYHAMGEHKYTAIGKEAITFSVPSEEKMTRLKNIFL
jgi:pyruvate formate lyase activating enzyme